MPLNKEFLKKAIRLFPGAEKLFELKRQLCDYGITAYSQEGEDLVLWRFFGGKSSGFYVDVGAHHPIRFSNTFLFYRKGWRGINIDAMPGSMKEFTRIRRADKNIEAAISDTEQELDFFVFNDPALNTFSPDVAKTYEKIPHFKVISKKKIRTTTLAEILEKELPPGQKIDFLSIDVEGLDENVLRSNNWKKFKPRVVLVELLNSRIDQIENNVAYLILREKGYRLFAKTINTFFFELIDDGEN